MTAVMVLSRRRTNDWPGHRRVHIDTLRLLAPHACDPPRHLRQSRPPRDRRRGYANCWRISRAFALGPTKISALPPSFSDVRDRTCLSVFFAASSPRGADVRWLATVAQRDGDQRGHRASYRRP